jgi:hypothetical protein
MDDQRTDREGDGIKFRKLRIVWSAIAVAVCVVLLLIRSSSFTRPVNLNIPGRHWATIICGASYFDASFRVSRGLSRPLPNSIVTDTGTPLTPEGKATAIPLLPIILLIGMAGVAGLVPWSQKFSLRAMLIATTLVAIALGILVYGSK